MWKFLARYADRRVKKLVLNPPERLSDVYEQSYGNQIEKLEPFAGSPSIKEEYIERLRKTAADTLSDLRMLALTPFLGLCGEDALTERAEYDAVMYVLNGLTASSELHEDIVKGYEMEAVEPPEYRTYSPETTTS